MFVEEVLIKTMESSPVLFAPANYINSEACIYDNMYVGEAVNFTPNYNL